MRVFVLVACVCAVAYGQLSDDVLEAEPKEDFNVEETGDAYENEGFSSLREVSDVGAASQDNVANVQENIDFNNANNGASLTEEGDVGDASQTNDDGDISKVIANSDARGRGSYQTSNQYDAQSASRLSSKTCLEKNERYPVPGSCDRYIECLNGTAEEKVCPDGLRYNPDVRFNVYPCQYPIDVPCLGRSALQPAQPTDDCPHQFGYFRTGDSKNCGTFKNCVNGVGYDFNCPEGLAFNSETYRCDWPDLVPECDVEAFLGFRCPEVPISKELGPPAGFRFYRSAEDCQKYFLCIDGKPRRLSCGGFSAFDELTETCVAADEISSCPLELRNRAEESRKAELQRQAAQNALDNRRKNQDITTSVPYYRSRQNLEEESNTDEEVQDIHDEVEETEVQ